MKRRKWRPRIDLPLEGVAAALVVIVAGFFTLRSQIVKNSMDAATVAEKRLAQEREERIALEGRVGELRAKLEAMPDLSDLTHMIADHQTLDVMHYQQLTQTLDAVKRDLDQIARFMKRVGDELVDAAVEARKGRRD